MQQQPLNLSLSLTARFPKLRDLLTSVVYDSRGSLNAVAADLDCSPSELSRMLNRLPQQGDPRKLDIEDFVGIIASTGDVRPIEWLIEKFTADPERRRAQATEELARLMPAIAELIEQAGGKTPAKGRR